MLKPPNTAQEMIRQLSLAPLPHEGGFFARTWTSAETLPGGRPIGTAILFLLTPVDFSALHVLDADEVWHFQGGDPVEHAQLHPSGTLEITHLGTDAAAGERPYVVARAGSAQGARLKPGPHTHGWALTACTMAPGWEDRCFTLNDAASLLASHPHAAALIRALTRTLG